jgi:Mor family transcriptional regulator
MPMARLTKPKPKKNERVGKTAQYIADLKFMGEEPVVYGIVELDDITLTKIFNWYNYMCTRSDARQYLKDFFKIQGEDTNLELLATVPDIWISVTAAWYARILNRGGILGMSHVKKFRFRLTEMFSKSTLNKALENSDDEETTIKVRKPTKISDFIGEFEEAIDNSGWTLSMYEWLQNKQIPSTQAKIVEEFYIPIAEEANQTLIDSKIKEGYSHYSVAELKKRAAFYATIITDCQRHASNKKKIVRKKKVISPDKKLKNLKFQAESKDFKVVSISPEKILGSSELMTFNTKYKTLTQFIALTESGLDVKGTTILNYDEDKSKTYKLGRNVEINIEMVFRSGRRAFLKNLEKLKTTSLQQRINENTILLKA